MNFYSFDIYISIYIYIYDRLLCLSVAEQFCYIYIYIYIYIAGEQTNHVKKNKTCFYQSKTASPASCGSRIHQLLLCRGVNTSHNKNPRCNIKPSDGEAPAFEILGIWNTPSLSLLLDQLWSGVVVSDRIYGSVTVSVSLFNGFSTFVGYLMLKPSFWKNSIGTGKIRGFIPFPRVFVWKWT